VSRRKYQTATNRDRVTLRLAVYRQSVQFILAPSPLRLTTNDFFFQLNTCGYSPYVTSSLTRGWVCRLQVMVALARAVMHGSESSGTQGHILLSQIRDSPILDGHVPVFTSLRKRESQLRARHCVSFSSSPTTRRAMVEVFEPAYTGAYQTATDRRTIELRTVKNVTSTQLVNYWCTCASQHAHA
jgi:hypothetical protein